MFTSNRTSPRVPARLAIGQLLIIALLIALLALPASSFAAPASAASLAVLKTPSVSTVIAPGATVTYTIKVENTSSDGSTVKVTKLDDDKFGNLFSALNTTVSNNGCLSYLNWPLPTLGSFFTCTFDGPVTGTAGTVHINTVTAGGVDNSNVPVQEAKDDAKVVIVDTGAIGDYVWYDANNNGLQDVLEEGLANVSLVLYKDNPSAGVVGQLDLNDIYIATEWTGQDGGYLFDGLLPGTYFVDVTDLKGITAGMVLTPSPWVAGTQSQTDPTPAIVLGVGHVYREADFGYYNPPDTGNAIIGDYVWMDYDGDGQQDPGEPGIPGVEVCAYPLPSGTKICATTDPSGHYLIEVPAGTYDVYPTGSTLPAVPGLASTTTNPITSLVLIAGQQYLDADFGYDSPSLGALGGTIWQDLNNNGTLDTGEPRLAGVSVDVRIAGANGTCEYDDPIVGTATTDQFGNYSFTGLQYDATNGTKYCVQVSDTQNRLDDYDPSTVYGVGDDQNKQQPYLVTINSIVPNNTADFAYVKEPNNNLGTIGNQVWVESDADGVWEPGTGEWPAEGVTLVLKNANGEVVATTTTGAAGDYVFTALPAGTYTVEVTDLFGILAGRSPTLFIDPNFVGLDNYNQTTNDIVSGLALVTNGSLMWVDFGYKGGPNAVTLSGLMAEAETFPIVPLVAGVIIGATAAVLVRRRRWA